MRLIKFRGRDINTGEVIFGDLRHIGIRTYIFKEAQCYYDEELIEVDEDSVAQLVGYDEDGKEVYEGDELILGDSPDKFTAVISRDVANGVGFIQNIPLDYLKLKEEL